MLNQFSRTQLLYGESAMQKLAAYRIAVFGIGGVGSYVIEALVPSVAGLIIAGEIINELTATTGRDENHGG